MQRLMKAIVMSAILYTLLLSFQETSDAVIRNFVPRKIREIEFFEEPNKSSFKNSFNGNNNFPNKLKTRKIVPEHYLYSKSLTDKCYKSRYLSTCRNNGICATSTPNTAEFRPSLSTFTGTNIQPILNTFTGTGLQPNVSVFTGTNIQPNVSVFTGTNIRPTNNNLISSEQFSTKTKYRNTFGSK